MLNGSVFILGSVQFTQDCEKKIYCKAEDRHTLHVTLILLYFVVEENGGGGEERCQEVEDEGGGGSDGDQEESEHLCEGRE